MKRKKKNTKGGRLSCEYTELLHCEKGKVVQDGVVMMGGGGGCRGFFFPFLAELGKVEVD